MAASSLSFNSFVQLHPSSNPSPKTRRDGKLSQIPAGSRIFAAVTTPPAKSSPENTDRPIKKMPGDYGLPLIGPITDRQDYFKKGREEFFKSRIQKHQSTVFRVNMPPGPPISSGPNVVALLDGKSFPTLFDCSKVEKKDLFTGTFMPSLELTGGYRVLSYLDPSEPSHEKLKRLLFKLVSSTRHRVIPEFHSSYSEMFDSLESLLATKGKALLNEANDQAAFNFLSRAWYDANPSESELGQSGPGIISKWVLFQLGPIMTLGLPSLLEELTLHTFSLPPALIKGDYQKIYNFIYQNSSELLDSATELGISRDEACHNLVFATCFNSFGGMKIFFPNMVKQIGRAGVKLHRLLAEEIRSAVRSNGGKITMAAMEQMPLMKSTVYEAFRIEPPVPFQYGRAKTDLVIESHDAAFKVKKGEMLFGYQPLATKDQRIFDRAEEFVPDRFVGEEGERMLKHVLWSNGPENESPTVDNKQCAGKDFVVLVSRLLLVELFLRYDSFEIDVGTSPLGAKITITSLKRATF